MGQEKHSYIIRLEAENGRAVTATLEQVGASGEKSMKQVGQGALTASRSVDVLSRSIVSRLIPAISAYQAASSIFKNMQEFERLDARIKFLTDSTEEYAHAQEFLRTKAKELNIDIFALSDGYARLLALQKGGIIDQNLAETILEGLANAKAALGATDVQIQQVLYGMGQAFSQVRVETAEFNQIMEPLPGFINNVGKAAGVTGAELKQMVKDGEVSGQMLAQWVAKAVQDFDGAAIELDGGIVAALADLDNAWKELAATIGDSTAITGGLSNIITLFADAADGARILVDRLNDLHTASKQDFTVIPPALDSEGKPLPTQAGVAGYEERIRRQMADLSTREFGWSPEFDLETGGGGIKGKPVPIPPSKPEEIILKGDKEREKAIQHATKEADAIRKVIEQLRLRNEEMDYSEAKQEVNNRLREAGVNIYSDEGTEIARLVYQYHRMKDAAEETADRQRMLADAVRDSSSAFKDLESYALDTLAEIGAAIIELGTGTGKGSGLGGLIAGSIFDIFSGVGSGGGLKYAGNGLPLPPPSKPSTGGGSFFGLKLFANGGIADRPSIFGEGPHTEAAVPLPDGRTIPVTLNGKSSAKQGTIIEYIDARGTDPATVDRMLAGIREVNGKVEKLDRSVEARSVQAVQNKFERSTQFLKRS